MLRSDLTFGDVLELVVQLALALEHVDNRCRPGKLHVKDGISEISKYFK